MSKLYTIDDEWQCEYCGWELESGTAHSEHGYNLYEANCSNPKCRWIKQPCCDECGSYEQAYNCMNLAGVFTHIPETTENEERCLCPHCFKRLNYLPELLKGKAFNFLPVRVQEAA